MPASTLLLTAVLLGTLPSPSSPPAAADVAAAAEKAFAPLPGEMAFVFTELTDQGPAPLFGTHEHERFAVGSSFKLYILGALADEVNADRRQLGDTLRLRADWVGPPNSEMAAWPTGAPVTLSTLALKMISVSDNTATDHLLHLLGRERIERQMAAMGHQHPEWNRPLLLTREMTMLRDRNTGMLGKQYQTLDEPARRQFLADKLDATPDYDALDFDTSSYDLVEWYATPVDMAHAMAWLQQATTHNQPAHPIRAILAVEPKLAHDPAVWPYVGFKGGSEDQLLCGNWLLQHRNGKWYTFHVFYNNPEQKADPRQLVPAIQQLFAAVEAAL